MSTIATETAKSTPDATTESDTKTTTTADGDTALDTTATPEAAVVDTTSVAADTTSKQAATTTTTDAETKSPGTVTTTSSTASPNADISASGTVSSAGPTEAKTQQIEDTYHTCDEQGTAACETAIQQHETAVILGVLGLVVVLLLLWYFPIRWWRNSRKNKPDVENNQKRSQDCQDAFPGKADISLRYPI
ncbi:MAG: hypothetical protein TREMPRED_004530 [Tremellales sp. Tagirdzhanova-0007]|nr:MAG: hypothetical protein TREMPRED_004530 [Tremellales sp. Tagirdzhanova-0007]